MFRADQQSSDPGDDKLSGDTTARLIQEFPQTNYVLIKGGFLQLSDCKSRDKLTRVYTTTKGVTLDTPKTKAFLLEEFERASINGYLLLCNFLRFHPSQTVNEKGENPLYHLSSRLYAPVDSQGVLQLFDSYRLGEAEHIEFYRAPPSFFRDNDLIHQLARDFPVLEPSLNVPKKEKTSVKNSGSYDSDEKDQLLSRIPNTSYSDDNGLPDAPGGPRNDGENSSVNFPCCTIL